MVIYLWTMSMEEIYMLLYYVRYLLLILTTLLFHLLVAMNYQPSQVFEEPSDSQMLGVHDTLQTTGRPAKGCHLG
ncbi:hypothetical protein QYF36_006963 [Acer negundo]|nr:hypothetical protein QYF36_006963 [Acer negundo]